MEEIKLVYVRAGIPQILKFVSVFLRYELAEDCADDEEDKNAIRKLKKRMKDKIKSFGSIVRVSFMFFPYLFYFIYQIPTLLLSLHLFILCPERFGLARH